MYCSQYFFDSYPDVTVTLQILDAQTEPQLQDAMFNAAS